MSNEHNPADAGSSGQSNDGGNLQDTLNSAKDQVRQKAEDLRASAESKAKDLKEAATAKVEDLRAKAEDYYGQAKEKAGTYYDQAKGQAEDYYGQAKDRARTLQDDGEAYVRENPLRAVLIAVGAGFVLGNLFKR